MGAFEVYKPAIAMVGLQFGYAAVSLSTRVALLQGMSPRVFVVYRQAIATLVISPIAYFSRCPKKEKTKTKTKKSKLFFHLYQTISVRDLVFISPYYRRKSGGGCSMGFRSLNLIFLASLIG